MRGVVPSPTRGRRFSKSLRNTANHLTCWHLHDRRQVMLLRRVRRKVAVLRNGSPSWTRFELW